MRYHQWVSSNVIRSGDERSPCASDVRMAPDFDLAAFLFFRQFNGSSPQLSLNDFLIRFERAVVFNALVEMNGCQRKAAAFLKLKNTTLNRKIKAQRIRFAKIPLLPEGNGAGSSGGSPEREW